MVPALFLPNHSFSHPFFGGLGADSAATNKKADKPPEKVNPEGEIAEKDVSPLCQTHAEETTDTQTSVEVEESTVGGGLPGEGGTQQGVEMGSGGAGDAVQQSSGEDGMVMKATVALNVDGLDNGHVDDVLGDVLGDPVKGDLETVSELEMNSGVDGVADVGGDNQEMVGVGGGGEGSCTVTPLVGQDPSDASEAGKMDREGENDRGIDEATPPSFTGADSCVEEERMEVDPLVGMEQSAQVGN